MDTLRGVWAKGYDDGQEIMKKRKAKKEKKVKP
jgi:hypothetical protein